MTLPDMESPPGLERVRYQLRGPHVMVYADQAGVDVAGAVTIGYDRHGDAGPRQWIVEFAVDRAFLLPMSRAGVIGVTPVDILNFNIQDPIALTFQPSLELAAELNAIEDREPIVSPVTRLLDGRVRMKLRDVRNLRFVRASQPETA